MVRRTTSPPQPPKPPLALTISREDASKRISAQIDRAKTIIGAEIQSYEALDAADADSRKWRDYVSRLLEMIFTNDDLQTEFRYASYAGAIFLSGTKPLQTKVEELRRDVREGIGCLESIIERLELYDEPTSAGIVPIAAAQSEPRPSNRKIFIVHGHDEAAKLAVARFLEAIDLRPIILHEQANEGRTIIEKFERNADVAYAVVLMTPDDIGGPVGSDGLQPRARQNVIAELGYFVGKLGRGHVMPLVKGDVEIPTDFSGVVYTNLDAAGAWKMTLAKELHAAGIHIDPAKLFAA
ncbi:TIR domain-containing protein [Azospirillum largimobile]